MNDYYDKAIIKHVSLADVTTVWPACDSNGSFVNRRKDKLSKIRHNMELIYRPPIESILNIGSKLLCNAVQLGVFMYPIGYQGR